MDGYTYRNPYKKSTVGNIGEKSRNVDRMLQKSIFVIFQILYVVLVYCCCIGSTTHNIRTMKGIKFCSILSIFVDFASIQPNV